MKKKSNIAVILVNYNGAEDTIECINSIKNSTVYVDIIVVDNASKDDDIGMISGKFPGIKIIMGSKNLGFAGGNNLGIKYALETGYKYIMLLNNDTVIDKNMIAKLRNFADESLVVLPVMYYYDKPEKIWYSGGCIDRRTGVVKHIKQAIGERDDIQYCEFATGCCMMIHQDIIRKIGMLDESFFMYCEDEEYSLRLIKHNINIAVITEAKLWHKVARASGKNSSFFEYYLSRNRMICIKKHRDYFYCSAYIYSLCTRILKIIFYFIKRDGRCRSCMYAILDASKNQYIRRY